MLYENFYPTVEAVGGRNIRCHRSFTDAVESIQTNMPDVWSQIRETVSNSDSCYTEYVVFPNLAEGKLQPKPLKERVDTNMKLKHVKDSGPSIDDDLKYTYETIFVTFTK